MVYFGFITSLTVTKLLINQSIYHFILSPPKGLAFIEVQIYGVLELFYWFSDLLVKTG